MISIVGDPVRGDRFALLQAAEEAGIPMTDILVLPSAVSDHVGGRPADGELLAESAIVAEWQSLKNPPASTDEDETLEWMDRASASAALVRSGRGDPFGTAIARGRADVLQTLHQVRASCVFNAIMSDSEQMVTLSALESGPLQPVTAADPGPARQWMDRLAAAGIARSWWTAGAKPALADAGGPPVDPGAPFSQSSNDIRPDPPVVHDAQSFESRVVLGRFYNRILLPNDPFEWMDLLTSPIASPEMFLGAATARQREGARILLEHAVTALADELRSGRNRSPATGGEAPEWVRPGGYPAVRQVVGHPGAPGKTEGVVTHLRQTGGPEPKVSGLTVLVCHHVEPWMQDHVARAAAVVERAGSRLGLGSVLARRAGIPLVCGAREAGLLVEGSRAGVSGDSGIVTVTSQT